MERFLVARGVFGFEMRSGYDTKYGTRAAVYSTDVFYCVFQCSGRVRPENDVCISNLP